MLSFSLHPDPDTILSGQSSNVVLRLRNDGSNTYTGIHLRVQLPSQVIPLRGDIRLVLDRLDGHQQYNHILTLKPIEPGVYKLVVEGSCRGPAGENIQFREQAAQLTATDPMAVSSAQKTSAPVLPAAPTVQSIRGRKTVRYVDFELGLGADHVIRAFSVPQGEAQGIFSLDLAEIQALQAAIEQGSNLSASQIRNWGYKLYNALFPSAISSHLRATLAAAEATGCDLRIHLVLESPALAALPWELLYDEEHHIFLANATHTTLSRYLPVRVGLRDLRIDNPPLPVLLVLASPSDLPSLQIDAEERLIRRALATHITTGLIKLDVLHNPTPRSLNRVLQETPYAVLHFSGHGEFHDDQGQLFLVADSGKARSVDEETFSNLFLGTRHLGLIVLNACQSGTTGSRRAFTGIAPHLVRRGIPAVVAMQFPISDTIARIFAEEFYHALALGWPVDAALQATRNGIAMETGLESTGFATPVLFLRAREGIALIDPTMLPPSAG